MTARQAVSGDRPATAPQPVPATLATADDSGPPVAVPDAAAMNGHDRIRLLEWLCVNHPETVAAGVAALGAEVARNREARRVSRNRKSTLRWRARRRAAPG